MFTKGQLWCHVFVMLPLRKPSPRSQLAWCSLHQCSARTGGIAMFYQPACTTCWHQNVRFCVTGAIPAILYYYSNTIQCVWTALPGFADDWTESSTAGAALTGEKRCGWVPIPPWTCTPSGTGLGPALLAPSQWFCVRDDGTQGLVLVLYRWAQCWELRIYHGWVLKHKQCSRGKQGRDFKHGWENFLM